MAGCTFTKARVLFEHEVQINRFSLLLCEDVEANDLTVYLMSNFIFDSEDIEFIKGANARKDRMQNLLSRLTCRGRRAYPELKNALKHAGYNSILSRMEKEEDIDPKISCMTREKVKVVQHMLSKICNKIWQIQKLAEVNHTELMPEIKQLSGEVSRLRRELLGEFKSLLGEKELTDSQTNRLNGMLNETVQELEKAEMKTARLEEQVSALQMEVKNLKEVQDKMAADAAEMKSIVEKLRVDMLNVASASQPAEPKENAKAHYGRLLKNDGPAASVPLNNTARKREEHTRQLLKRADHKQNKNK